MRNANVTRLPCRREKFSTMRSGSEYTAGSNYFHNWNAGGAPDVRDEERRGQLPLDLDCAHRHVMAASFVPGSDEQAGVFSCVIGALSDETVAVLDRALQEHARVRLLFSDRSLLLEFVKLERKGPQSVRIVGQLVAAAAKSSA
jgi:hypothetical protein